MSEDYASDAPDSDNPFDEDDIRARVLDDLRDRDVWMRRQATWYQMRHDGLRRSNKPWPWAADLHMPLSDMQIEKLKPFYFNQMFATQTVASFIPRTPDMQPVVSAVGNYFDYKLKQESNVETEILVTIDKMLMAGFCPVVVRWDTQDDCLQFDAIEPSHLIVPQWTRELEKADRVTVVRTCSKEQYMRDPRFTQKDPNFVKTIMGRNATQDGTNQWLEQLKMVREGQSYFDYTDQVVYWEIWEKCLDSKEADEEEGDSEEPETDAGDEPEGTDAESEEPEKEAKPKPYWMVHFLSPYTDKPLRPSMRNPFKHGKLPIVRFQVEVKDTDHYSSRGIPERIGQFETAATKQWNEKNDFMTLVCRPLFSSDSPIPQTGNMKFIPGQILGEKITAVNLGSVPDTFEEEMEYQRGIAEQLVGVPDYGQGQEGKPHDPRTATEIQSISSVMNVGVDLKARVFRQTLGALYNLAWQTLLQYDQEASYIVGQQMDQLQPETMEQLRADPDLMKIVPNGSGDSWNRDAQLQKAVQLKTLFANSPWINQQEVDKRILELVDPRLVDQLFTQNEYTQDQYRDEAEQIPVMMLGFPMPVEPDDDHATRIKCLADFMQQRAHLGFPPDPVGLPVLTQHIAQHMQALQQQDPAKARQVAAGLKQMQAQAAKNVVPMQQGKAPKQPPQNPEANQPKHISETMSIAYADMPPDVQRQVEAGLGLTPSTIGGSSPLEQNISDAHDKAAQAAKRQPPQMPPGNQVVQ